MVMDYSDIYQSVARMLPDQDWWSPEWHVRQSGDAIEVFRENWRKNDGEPFLLYRSYGQGKDPEQQPIVMEIRFGSSGLEPDAHRDALLDDLEPLIRPLIGWHEGEDDRLLLRKELPSDPLTLQPRLLQELKLLEPLAYAVDDYLDGRREVAANSASSSD